MRRTQRKIRSRRRATSTGPDKQHTEKLDGQLGWRVDLTWAELQSELAELPARYGGSDGNEIAEEGWHGPALVETLKSMAHGSPELAQEAEAGFVEALDACMADTDGAVTREAGPVGSYPNVPAFVQGRPDSMWGAGEDIGLGPVRLFVGIGCQSGVSHEQMLKRGIAIAALAYAMQSVRPVELWICYMSKAGEGKNHLIFQCRLAIAPLDLSLVSVAVAATGIGRRVLRFGKSMHEYGGFSTITATSAFELGPEDLYFPNVVPGDLAKLDADPLAFILSQVNDQKDCRLSTRGRADKHGY